MFGDPGAGAKEGIAKLTSLSLRMGESLFHSLRRYDPDQVLRVLTLPGIDKPGGCYLSPLTGHPSERTA